MSISRVLVTGASGFIGRQLVADLLALGYEVHAVINSRPLPEQAGLVQHQVNLLDEDAVSAFFNNSNIEYESLFHMAWYVGKKCQQHDLNIDWTIATLNLIKQFARHGGKCFVGTGTCTEYDYEYGYLNEDFSPTKSSTLYGSTKSSLFTILEQYCSLHNISFKWPRIFNLYGPYERQARLMPSVIISCLKGEDVLVSDCLKYQDYLHVSDATKGIISFFKSSKGGALNICSGQPVQLRYIVKLIAELTEFKGDIRWGAVPAAFDNDVVVGNNRKLRALGWVPEYDLRSGLARTINWWKKELNKTKNT